MLDQPAPQATSAIAAGGSADSRSYVRHRRKPLARQQVGELRTVRGRLRLAPFLAVRRPGHAATAAERLLEGGKHGSEGDGETRHRHDVGEALGIEEHLLVPGRDRVAALPGSGPGVVDGEYPGHRLLLEPLPGVALVRSGRLCELGRRRVVPLGERAVEAQPVPEVDREELVRAESRAAEALGESVGNRLCHVCYR